MEKIVKIFKKMNIPTIFCMIILLFRWFVLPSMIIDNVNLRDFQFLIDGFFMGLFFSTIINVRKNIGED
jgi:Na+/glutamate symporter